MKKAMFLSLISILMVFSLVVAFSIIPPRLEMKDKADITKTRIQTATSFVGLLESEYLDLAIRTSASNAFNALTKNLTDINGYSLNLNHNFSRIFINGTFNGAKINSMEKKTIGYYLNETSNQAQESYKINADFRVYNVNLSHENPWLIRIETNMSYFIDAGVATWTNNETRVTLLNIDQLNDPLYNINTNGNFINEIDKTSVNETEWDIDKLIIHQTEREYRTEPNAPSFLMRFTGDFQESEFGISSVVNRSVGGTYGLDTSYADYCYFYYLTKDTILDQCEGLIQEICPTGVCPQGVTPIILLDTYNYGRYTESK